MEQKKFRVLRIVATIWKVLAWIALVISVLAGCITAAGGLLFSGAGTRAAGEALGTSSLGPLGGIAAAFLTIFLGIFYFISLYAFAELVDVMLALEENTRLTAEQLKNIAKS